MQPIVIVDSGVGGLPYLSWIMKNLPHEKLIYIADRQNFPYGEKAPGVVRDAVVDLAQTLCTTHDPKLLIIACNTASVYALEALREVLDIPVVGVVPAIKTAAQATKNGRIGILATELTVRSSYLAQLIQEFAADKCVMSFSAGDIVRLVEEDYLYPDTQERDNLLQGWAERIKTLDIDTVVLGCTHFLHVIPELKRWFGNDVILVDSQSGVGRRAEYLLKERGLLAVEGEEGGEFWVHWEEGKVLPKVEMDKYKNFSLRFGLNFKGLYRNTNP